MEFLSVIAIIFSIMAFSKASEALVQVKALNALRKTEDKEENNQNVMSASVPLNKVSEEREFEVNESIDPVTLSIIDEEEKEFEEDYVKEQVVVEKKESEFIIWLKEDWLLKLGGVLVIMGVLFFLSLAYQAVGVGGKVAIGYIFGITLMGLGYWYAKKQIVGGSAIHLVGALVIIITTYFAHLPSVALFGQIPAMGLMFITTVCVALTAYTYNRASLAHVGLFGAAMVPILVSTGSNNFTGLLSYLAIVILGVLWLAFVTNWRTLILMSLCILIGYSSTFIAGGMGDLPMTALQSVMITTFGIVFYLTSLFSILRTRGVTNTVDGAVALLNAGFALLWIIGEIQPELIPIYIAIVGLIYAVGFFLLYKVTNVYTSFLIYGGVALGMLTTAIMYELSGRSLAYVLLFMGALVTVFTYHLSRDEKITKIIALFNLLPFFHVLIAMNTVFEVIMYNKPQENVWKDVLVMVIAITVYFGLFRYFKDRSKKLGQVALFVVIAGSITLLWQVLHLLIGGMFASSLAALITGVGLTIFAQVYFDNDEAIIKKFALINSITVLYGLISLGRIGDSLSSSYYMVDVWKDWVFVFLVMGTSLAFYFYYTNKIKAISRPALTASLFFLSVSVWQVFHLVLPEGIATFISVLIYTLVGLTTLFLGSRDGNTTMVKISRIWLGFVAARVILWDAWQTGSVTAGVFICVVTGVLLLSSSFIVKKVTQ